MSHRIRKLLFALLFVCNSVQAQDLNGRAKDLFNTTVAFESFRFDDMHKFLNNNNGDYYSVFNIDTFSLSPFFLLPNYSIKYMAISYLTSVIATKQYFRPETIDKWKMDDSIRLKMVQIIDISSSVAYRVAGFVGSDIDNLYMDLSHKMGGMSRRKFNRRFSRAWRQFNSHERYKAFLGRVPNYSDLILCYPRTRAF